MTKADDGSLVAEVAAVEIAAAARRVADWTRKSIGAGYEHMRLSTPLVTLLPVLDAVATRGVDRLERYVRAMVEADDEDMGEWWQEYSRRAQAAMSIADAEVAAALAPPTGAGEVAGFKLVPIKPTQEMVEAAARVMLYPTVPMGGPSPLALKQARRIIEAALAVVRFLNPEDKDWLDEPIICGD